MGTRLLRLLASYGPDLLLLVGLALLAVGLWLWSPALSLVVLGLLLAGGGVWISWKESRQPQER